MKAQIEKAHEHLGELAVLAAQTDADEKRILRAAISRLSEIQSELDKFENPEFSEADKQQAYLDLITERGQLHIVIEKAKAALGVS